MTGYCDGCGNQMCICGVGENLINPSSPDLEGEIRNCVTHHYACECREKQFKQIEVERSRMHLAMTTGDRNWTQLLAERDEYKAALQEMYRIHGKDETCAKCESNAGDGHIASCKARKPLEKYGVKA